jgi:hypothetical protein
MAGDRRFVQATAAFQITVRKSMPASHQGRILVKKLTLEVSFYWQMAVADDNGIDRTTRRTRVLSGSIGSPQRRRDMRFSRLLEGRFQNMLLQVRVRSERLLSALSAKMCLLQQRSLRAAIRCGQRESPVRTNFSNALAQAYSVILWAARDSALMDQRSMVQSRDRAGG